MDADKAPMKVFISHSTADEPLVEALQALIRDSFVETVEVFYSSAPVSSGGIEPGQDWLDWIHIQVQASAMTIVVLTPLAKARPWLIWEAGAVSGVALARGVSTPVVPLLFGIPGSEVPSPLQARQTKSGTSPAGIKDVLESMRRAGNLSFKPDEQRQSAIASYVARVTEVRIPGMYDLFISSPMTTLDVPAYAGLRKTITFLIAEVTARGYSAYSAVTRI
jgi:TIR domain